MRWYWECLCCPSKCRRGFKGQKEVKTAAKRHLKIHAGGEVEVYQAKFCMADIKHYRAVIVTGGWDQSI
jgi:hypothetical protein